MSKVISGNKVSFLAFIVLIYALFAVTIIFLVNSGTIHRMPPPIPTVENVHLNTKTGNEELRLLNENPVHANLDLAKEFFNKNLNNNYHINLLHSFDNKTVDESNFTNSEAISYYLLWNVQDSNKYEFDRELDFMEKNMIEPDAGYMMWKLDSNDSASGTNRNMASDADLRTIKALLMARSKWKDERYKKLSYKLISSLEGIAVSSNSLFAPYGGVINGTYWKSQETWLSYTDFEVFRQLAYDKGNPWIGVYDNMKKAVINSQTPMGFYNAHLDEFGNYDNNIDGGNYSLNSLWVMVRSAESEDKELMESATVAINFYKDRFDKDSVLYTSYNINGEPVFGYESPWVYALVGRAAIALDDREFSEKMVNKLISMQSKDNESEGSFIEYSGDTRVAGQFTLQESIITMQAYLSKYEFN